MQNINKGRFKSADEAHAVWNVFWDIFPNDGVSFKSSKGFSLFLFNDLARILHKARLIHGSICDENGRVEDKDVAHYLVLCSGITNKFHYHEGCSYFDSNLTFSADYHLKQNDIEGTIFY